jgi:hypothetical protein
MATYTEKRTAIEEKIAKLDVKIEKAVSERKKLVEEYDRVSFLALAETYKLKGKDLFDAIERDHAQMKKLREDGLSEDDISELTEEDFFDKEHRQTATKI